jgi:hypothetical protein
MMRCARSAANRHCAFPWTALALAGALWTPAAWAQRGAPPGPPPTARVAAALDLEGYWVSVVSEDWRYRMVTPTKGDYQSVPMTQAALKVADAWDPVADEKTGLQCKSYGAPAIMRVPARLRVTWQDDQTLKVEVDAGTQTRLFKFGAAAPLPERSWQGDSTASWEVPRAARGRGAAAAAPVRNGSLKVVTTNLRAGYLRKNGVPYGDNATVTEYFSVARLRGGQEVLVVTAVVEDPQYLTQPFIVSSHFKKQADASGWEPTPCSAHW